jgi:general secretion pathway protein G
MRKTNNKAFTLVELMAVLLIIALLAGVGIREYLGTTDKAKVTVTKASLRDLHSAVTQFKLDTGRYPTEEMGLVELIEQPTDVIGWVPGGYLQTTSVPLDAWKNEFVYQLNPESGKPFVMISYGADGRQGGEGYDADLNSTDAN